MQQNQNSQPVSVCRDRKEVKHHRELWGMIKTSWVYLCTNLTRKNIGHKYRCIMTKKLPNMSEVHRVAQNNFCRHSELVWTRKNQNLNHTPKFLTASAGQRGLPKMSIGKHAFTLFLCLFEPKTIGNIQCTIF